MPATVKRIDVRSLLITLGVLLVAAAAGFGVGLWLGS